MAQDPGLLNIRYETLDQAKTDLAAAYAGAQATISELETKLNQSLAEWTGDAQEAYAEAKLAWSRAFTHMQTVLNQAQVHVGNASDMYQAVERQNQSIWK